METECNIEILSEPDKQLDCIVGLIFHECMRDIGLQRIQIDEVHSLFSPYRCRTDADWQRLEDLEGRLLMPSYEAVYAGDYSVSQAQSYAHTMVQTTFQAVRDKTVQPDLVLNPQKDPITLDCVRHSYYLYPWLDLETRQFFRYNAEGHIEQAPSLASQTQIGIIDRLEEVYDQFKEEQSFLNLFGRFSPKQKSLQQDMKTHLQGLNI